MSQNRSLRVILLNWLLKPKNNTVERGFTLVELLVVILIGGILSAIALPSILNHSLKARESEARLYISTINKAQQNYYMEKTRFSDTIDKLSLGLPTATENYTYTIPGPVVLSSDSVIIQADRKQDTLRSFSGQVWVGVVDSKFLTSSVFCESDVNQAPPGFTADHQCSP